MDARDVPDGLLAAGYVRLADVRCGAGQASRGGKISLELNVPPLGADACGRNGTCSTSRTRSTGAVAARSAWIDLSEWPGSSGDAGHEPVGLIEAGQTLRN